jgi:hypothetical protein
MSGRKCNISLVIVLVSLFSVQAFSQQINYRDSLAVYNSQKVNLKPSLTYSVGSTFMFVPHWGTVTGFTLNPSLSIPLSQKWSVEAGIIAGRYYPALRNFSPEGAVNGAFNELSVYGSASYHINPQLTLYGIGMKQLTGTSVFNILPKSSYAIGSTYKFSNFSIGVSVQMSNWNDMLDPIPFNGTKGFYSPYEQRPGTLTIFGR